MKPILLTAIFIFEMLAGAAQKNLSLADTNRVTLLNEQAAVSLSKPEASSLELSSAVKYLQQAVSLTDSLRLDFDARKYKTLCLLGRAYIRTGNPEMGKKTFMDLVKFSRESRDKKREAEIWLQLAQALSTEIKEYITVETALANSISRYREMNNKRQEIIVRMELAFFHFESGKQNVAEQEYLELAKESETNKSYKLPDIYFFLSLVNRYQGNFNKALRFALHAVKSMEELKDSVQAHNYFGELAEVYQAMDKHVESAYWYKRCLEKREASHKYNDALYRTYSMLVIQLVKAGNEKEALSIIRDLAKRSPPVTLAEQAAFSQSLAYCFEALGKYELAEKYYLESVDKYTSANIEPEVILIANYDVAAFYIRNKEFKKASRYLSNTSDPKITTTTLLKQNLELLHFKVDSAAGGYISAIKHFQNYKLLNDSIFNEAKSNQIEELQIQYKTEKKDQDIRLKDQSIELLTKRDQLQRTTLQQATTSRNMILGSTLLLSLFLALGYNRYRLEQQTNKRLGQQQKEINQKNISLQHLVDEKEWLVKEIHHRVKNNFHTVMGLLGTQSSYLKNDEALVAMSESQHRIHAMSLVHQKLYQSENLSVIDMPNYIYELVEYLKDSFSTGTKIRYQLDIESLKLDLAHAIPLGLILNEAITNAIKYAFAEDQEGQISITLKHTTEDQILLSIADDGQGVPIGFEPYKRTSMGMNLMQGLSEDIGGNFTITNDHGTHIEILFRKDPELSTFLNLQTNLSIP